MVVSREAKAGSTLSMKFVLSLIATLLFFIIIPAAAQEEGASFTRTLDSPFMGGESLSDAGAIRDFYAQRAGAPYWRSDDPILQAIKGSWQHGLNPFSYHLAQIEKLSGEISDTAQAVRDILLTDAFIHYAKDMSGMRVSAKALGLNPADWLHPYETQVVLGLLKDNADIHKILGELPPHGRTYAVLQNELVRLSREPEAPYASVLPIQCVQTLQPGWRDACVPALRTRLGVRAQTTDNLLYDDRLAAAVIKFQKQSGLQADGFIGPTTLRLLNRTNRDRMLQIIANLERLRWVGEERPARFVMVSIPAATLWAVEDGRVAFEMPVIVGKRGRETPSFIATIEGVRFNPGWTVPPTIKRKDIVPKLAEDPNYLTNKGMELIQNTSDGPQTIDPVSVDWKTVTDAELRTLEMVQIPGAQNPLGRIRILMPNTFDVYLHDTNQPEYFDRQQRAQSSGCIRMKDPEKMAAFVMKGEKGWSEARMKEILGGTRTRDILIAKPIPVYVLYYSAWVDHSGKIIFGNDIYDMDRALLGELAKIDGFFIPGHNEGI